MFSWLLYWHCENHDDVIKWKHFPRYCPFVRGIHQSLVKSPRKGQWQGALMFSLIYAWTHDWVNNRDASDLRLPLRWRHNGHDYVLNNQPHHCLLNGLFGRRSKKTSKLRVTGLCAGNSPGTVEFPAQMANIADNDSIWWRHNDRTHYVVLSCTLVEYQTKINSVNPNLTISGHVNYQKHVTINKVNTHIWKTVTHILIRPFHWMKYVHGISQHLTSNTRLSSNLRLRCMPITHVIHLRSMNMLRCLRWWKLRKTTILLGLAMSTTAGLNKLNQYQL